MFKDLYKDTRGNRTIRPVLFTSRYIDFAGDGSYQRPFKGSLSQPIGNEVTAVSGGIYDNLTINSMNSSSGFIIGQGMFATKIKKLSLVPKNGHSPIPSIYDLEFDMFEFSSPHSRQATFFRCLLKGDETFYGNHTRRFVNCISTSNKYQGNHFSYIDVEDLTFSSLAESDLSTIESSIVIVDSIPNQNIRLAFDRCEFVFDGTNKVKLAGETSAERKSDFIRHCNNNGKTATVPNVLFCDNNIFGGSVSENSELDKKQIAEKVYYGYMYKSAINIQFTNETYKQGHISDNSNGIEIDDNLERGYISVNTAVKNTLTIDSSVLYLDGDRVIESIDLVNDLDGIHQKIIATPNRFEGDSFYSEKDYSIKQQAQIRFVDDIPKERIVNGDLTDGYYYYVTYGSQEAKENGYVIYKGKKYICGDSFLCETNLDFTIPDEFKGEEGVFIRRCWHKDFKDNENPDGLDSSFWSTQIKKPNWIRFDSTDIRAEFENNNERTETIKKINGEYLTSAHPLFYPNQRTGDIPAFNISARFMQVKIFVQTDYEK